MARFSHVVIVISEKSALRVISLKCKPENYSYFIDKFADEQILTLEGDHNFKI